ncbi:MAG: hypothetical protein CMJ49_00415 [Planctomycetaceae bacterium]|nr:hypothetical protein [Planctomycetaceae bacterium]
MALLGVANLVWSYGDHRVLDGVNLTLDAGHRVGLVGRNGSGKTTLLKLIAGVEGFTPGGGHVQLARQTSVGYLTQDPELDAQKTLREEADDAFAGLRALHDQIEALAHEMATAEGAALEKLMKRYVQVEEQMENEGGYATDHRVEATLHGLGLSDEFFDVKVADLSGGQKGRLALAKLLLRHPDVLLLDEPTNHLDIAGCEWLEAFLMSYSGAVILVSHDRWLLDRVVDGIYEMEEGRLAEYPGNYHAYREQRKMRRLEQQRVYEKQRDRIRQEQAFIDRYRAGRRASQAQGRQKKLDRFIRDELIDRPSDLDEMNLAIQPKARCGEIVITAEDASKAYDGKVLFEGLTVRVKRGDRIGIVGPNGAGKSTLVRILLGEQASDTGRSVIGSAVSVGYYRQSHENLDLGSTVARYLQRFVAGGTEQEARDLAGAFLFSGDEQDKQLGALSGGERSRAVLAGLVAGGHNLLVLDEPTNHLDISGAERLEAALSRFAAEPKGYGQNVTGGGTLILVTHDRMLLEDLVDQLIVLDGRGGARHLLGTYSQHAALISETGEGAASEAGAVEAKVAADRPVKEKAARQVKEKAARQVKEKAARQEKEKATGAGDGGLSKLKQAELEQRIEEIETQVGRIDGRLADPEIYRDGPRVKGLQDERSGLVEALKPLEAEWARRAD